MDTWARREERKRRAKGFFPRSSDFHRLEFVEPRVKVHLLGEGYVYVPKKRDFSKDQREEFGGNRGLGFRKCPQGFLTVLLRSKR